MDLPARLRDTNTLIPNHPPCNHLVCVSSRLALGLVLVTNKPALSRNVTRGLALLLLAQAGLFVGMHVYKDQNWKVYTRAALALTTAGILLLAGKQEAAGMTIIADALLGHQSRAIASRMPG